MSFENCRYREAKTETSLLKRKHVTLTIQEKLEIISLVEDNVKSRAAIAAQFGIGKSTVHDIHKRSDKIKAFASLMNSEDVSKRRRLDQKARVEEEVPCDYNEKAEETMIDTIEGFEYDELNQQTYEVVYEAHLPDGAGEEIPEKQKYSPSKLKRSSKTLTFREKYEVIQQIETGAPVSVIRDTYGIGRTTIYDYMRRKQEIIDFVEKSNDGLRRTFKKSKYPEVEERLIEWCESNETFTRQQFFDTSKAAFDDARENGSITAASGFCGSWSWAKRFFHRHPELKTRLRTPTGQLIDASELSLSNVEYLDESVNDENTSTVNKNVKKIPIKKETKFLNLREKLKVLDEIDAGNTVPAIAEKFGISKTTVYEIYKLRLELRKETLSRPNYDRKVLKHPRYPDLERELLQWCLKQKHYPLSNVLIADKAMCIFDTLGLKGTFSPSSAWAKKFIMRHPELQNRESVEEYQDLTEDVELDMKQEDIEGSFEEQEEIEADEMTGSFEFMEAEIEDDSPEFQEEYIVEELDPQYEEQFVNNKNEMQFIKKEIPQEPTVPEHIAMKSLKILIKFAEQNHHIDILSNLIEYQSQLEDDDS